MSHEACAGLFLLQCFLPEQIFSASEVGKYSVLKGLPHQGAPPTLPPVLIYVLILCDVLGAKLGLKRWWAQGCCLQGAGVWKETHTIE